MLTISLPKATAATISEGLDAMKNCTMPSTAAEEQRTPSIVARRIFPVLLTKDHVVVMSELLGVSNYFEAPWPNM